MELPPMRFYNKLIDLCCLCIVKTACRPVTCGHNNPGGGVGRSRGSVRPIHPPFLAQGIPANSTSDCTLKDENSIRLTMSINSPWTLAVALSPNDQEHQ
jgi:hypothetical protein